MTDEQLKDETLTLLTAGHETVGAALSWTWYLLGQHSKVQEDLYDEVHGRLQGRNPTLEDLGELPLVRAVFEESLQLYPPAWGQPREALADDEINGFSIPAKGTVTLNRWVTHRHPDFGTSPRNSGRNASCPVTRSGPSSPTSPSGAGLGSASGTPLPCWRSRWCDDHPGVPGRTGARSFGCAGPDVHPASQVRRASASFGPVNE